MFQERIWRSQGSREKSEDGELVSVQPSQSQKFFSEVWFSSVDYLVSTIILSSVIFLQNLAYDFELVQGNYTSLLNNELLTIRKSENLTVKLFSIWIKKFKKLFSFDLLIEFFLLSIYESKTSYFKCETFLPVCLYEKQIKLMKFQLVYGAPFYKNLVLACSCRKLLLAGNNCQKLAIAFQSNLKALS